MFKAIGVIVALYVAYCVYRGEVLVRSRAWGKRVARSEAPREFWLSVGIYGLLAVALLTVF